MKKILVGLAAGLFAVACSESINVANAPNNNDLINQSLKGKIQRIEDVPYQVDSVTGQATVVDSCCTAIEEYDEKGYTARYTMKDSKGITKDDYTYTRFENSMLKEQVETFEGKPRISYSIQKSKDGGYGHVQIFDSTGKPDGYFTDIKADTALNLITGWKRFKADSNLHSIRTSVYEKKNHFIGFTETDSTEKVVKTIKAKNDENGNPIEWTTIDVTKDSTITNVVTFKYEGLDEKGNWTQRTRYEKGKPVKVLKRTITYYKD
jgi:hypothetical protein